MIAERNLLAMIKILTETFSPPGIEDNIRAFLLERFNQKFDEILTDNIGNLIAKSNDAENLCIECGMDSAGIMVVSKCEDKLFFSAVGNLDYKELTDKQIIFANGECGIVQCVECSDMEKIKISDLYIKMNTESIKIGDFGVVCADLQENDESYSAYGLKEKIGLVAVCQTISELENHPNITILFSAQKRLGGRGIKAFLGNKNFDKVILIDGYEEKSDDGCVIVAKDNKAVANIQLRKTLEEMLLTKAVISEENFLMENVFISGNTPKCVALGIPVKCEKGKPDIVKKEHLRTMVDLIKKLVERL